MIYKNGSRSRKIIFLSGNEADRGMRERYRGERIRLKILINFILDMLYPRKCPVCHQILKEPEKLICPECVRGFTLVGKEYCMKCGKPVDKQQEYCEECGKTSRNFTEGRSVFLYDHTIKNSLLKFKYDGRREYGEFYVKAMCHLAEKDIRRWKPDVIIPVPLHRKKYRFRGFNQAEYLARGIGRKLDIPVSTEILKKVKNTKSQKKLNAVERKSNLKNAFEVCEEIYGLQILIIDDVYTTGSTMDEISEVLKRKGAENVYFLTLCVGYN